MTWNMWLRFLEVETYYALVVSVIEWAWCECYQVYDLIEEAYFFESFYVPFDFINVVLCKDVHGAQQLYVGAYSTV